MTAQFVRRQPHRAQQIMGAVGRRYPRAWAQADAFRAMAAQDLHGAPCTTDTHCQQVAR